jgi:hypothetical protein
MKNTPTNRQIEAAAWAARIWTILGDERLFNQVHGHPWDRRSVKDWEWQLNYAHKLNLIAIGGK